MRFLSRQNLLLANAGLLLAASLQFGTTYIMKEGEKEVGRWEEKDGKSEVKTVGFEEKAAVPGTPAVPQQEAVYPWYEGGAGYKKALQAQKSTDDAIAIYFFTTWCPYCRKFEKNILNTPEVKHGLEPALKVKADAEKEEALSEKFGVNSYPRFYVVTPDLYATRLKVGVTSEEFLEECAEAGLKIKK